MGRDTCVRTTERLIILDFDGVVLDTERTSITVWQELLRECSLEPLGGPRVRPDRTLDREALRRHLTEAVGRRRTRALWSEFERRNRARADLLDAGAGVRPFLAHCRDRGHRLAIASGNERDWVEGHLSRLGIRSAFASVHCAGPGCAPSPPPTPTWGHCGPGRPGGRAGHSRSRTPTRGWPPPAPPGCPPSGSPTPPAPRRRRGPWHDGCARWTNSSAASEQPARTDGTAPAPPGPYRPPSRHRPHPENTAIPTPPNRTTVPRQGPRPGRSAPGAAVTAVDRAPTPPGDCDERAARPTHA
ncbi:HAD hydrolase-like protein [Streptomyces parvulus]|nr:HAD hydrolase-like protein [Streptomyces parvulus]